MPCGGNNQELMPNHFVYINVHRKFFKIGNVEPMQYDTGREATAFFSSLAATTGTSGFVNITELDPDDIPNRTLFQLMVGVQYKMRYYFKVPTGTNRFGTDVTKSIGYLTPEISPYQAPNKDFQIWLVDQYYPAVDARNDSSEALTPRIRFTGFKYELVEVTPEEQKRLQSGQQVFKHVTVGGLN